MHDEPRRSRVDLTSTASVLGWPLAGNVLIFTPVLMCKIFDSEIAPILLQELWNVASKWVCIDVNWKQARRNEFKIGAASQG